MHVTVILSGGLDSTVLLAHLLDRGDTVRALSFNYGQRHRVPELGAAVIVARCYGIRHDVVDLVDVGRCLGMSALLGAPVPHGHYAEESMKATVVPNRNMIMLAIAAGAAMADKADAVAFGAHAGDHTIYPDCRPEFADALNKTIKIADWHPMHLERPFITWTKADIVRRGAELHAPMDVTWSCYEGGEKHCGKCGTCVERREAFALARVADPTEYA